MPQLLGVDRNENWVMTQKIKNIFASTATSIFRTLDKKVYKVHLCRYLYIPVNTITLIYAFKIFIYLVKLLL